MNQLELMEQAMANRGVGDSAGMPPSGMPPSGNEMTARLADGGTKAMKKLHENGTTKIVKPNGEGKEHPWYIKIQKIINKKGTPNPIKNKFREFSDYVLKEMLENYEDITVEVNGEGLDASNGSGSGEEEWDGGRRRRRRRRRKSRKKIRKSRKKRRKSRKSRKSKKTKRRRRRRRRK